MNRQESWTVRRLVLGAGGLCLSFVITTSAQVQTQVIENGQATKQIQVERATVITVSGNDLVVKMEDGTIRHFPNIPESARATVDGKELGIHDLKPGMTLQRTIATTTTPRVIVTAEGVTGKVWYVAPPTKLILTLPDGTNQQFKIPNGQKFNIDGQMVDAWGLKKGMTVTAEKVVEETITVVNQQRKLTGSMPPAPQPPPADAPILVAAAAPTPAPAPSAAPSATETASASLPKTGSELPLLGLLGLLSLLSGLGLKVIRKAA